MKGTGPFGKIPPGEEGLLLTLRRRGSRLPPFQNPYSTLILTAKRKLSLRGVPLWRDDVPARRSACLRPARRGFAQTGVPARRRGNLMRLLHGVYPEQNNEILRFAQNDKKRRVRNDILCVPTYLGRSLW
jgi:hypothetical protein